MVRIVGFDLDDTLYSRIELYRDVFNSMQDNVIKTDVLFEDFYIMFQIKNDMSLLYLLKKKKKIQNSIILTVASLPINFLGLT